METLNNRSASVIQSIKNDIIEGVLKPGDRLRPLRELAQNYHVSRSIINCVISTLVAKGFVTVLPRHYIMVNDILKCGSIGLLVDVLESNNLPLKLKLLKDVLVLRKTIEIDSLRKLIAEPEISIPLMKPTMDLISNWLKSPKNDVQQLINLDAQFHQSLMTSTNNTVYGLLYNEFEVLTRKMTAYYYQTYDLAVQNFKWYEQVFEAIKEKNESKAIRILEMALDHGATYVLRLIY